MPGNSFERGIFEFPAVGKRRHGPPQAAGKYLLRPLLDAVFAVLAGRFDLAAEQSDFHVGYLSFSIQAAVCSENSGVSFYFIRFFAEKQQHDA